MMVPWKEDVTQFARRHRQQLLAETSAA